MAKDLLIRGGIAAGVTVGALSAMRLASLLIEKKSNAILNKPPYPIRPETNELHQRLFVADLHADALLWDRDLLRRHTYGHVDVPRLIEGNYTFQVFGVVTKSPKGQNFESNSGGSDNISLLAMLEFWPLPAWSSLFERAYYQGRKLQKFAQRSNGRLMLVGNQADLDTLLNRRMRGEKVVGGFPCLEGVHALEACVDNVDRLYDVGFRMIGMAHFFDNEAGGSAHGLVKGGLTPFGREVVKRVQAKKMILDLAHSSPKVIDDALDLSQAPVVVSHTGVRGTCDSIRNLTDEHIKRVAETGGVMGIAMFDTAVGGHKIEDTVRAMAYVTEKVGVDHVALGTDFDGVVAAPVDSSGIPLVTQGLMDAGFHDDEIAKIMGGNFLRVLRAVLE